ncbi:MAG: rhomboid family intramembrane serine protease [Candidatus Hydrogenedentes bacterium]|nr:rhomboid family intramembrane serine protease [Candidatus Hydrogenedentota bacterium]
MDRETKILALLERLGFNTTRLRWKLYSWQKRRENRQGGIQLPAALHWMKYPHKHCMHCGKLVDGDAKTCTQCGRRMPSLYTYRFLRLVGLALPEGAPVTIGAFLAVMVAVFLFEIAMQGPSAIMNPSRFTLFVFGGWNSILVLGHNEYWRFLGFGLAHIGILHIAFNGIALLQVGPGIESWIGKVRMLVVITFTQITAGLATHVWYFEILYKRLHDPYAAQMTTAGASGWLFGLIGFGIALFWHQVGVGRMYRDILVRWAIYALLFGFIMGANNAAHVGGLLGGLLLGFVPRESTTRAPYWNPIWNTAAFVSAALWLVTVGFLIQCVYVNWTPGGVAPG